MGTAPSGGSAVFDVKKNGVSIFSGSYPTVTNGNNTSTPISRSVALTTSDYLTVDCTTANGADAVIRIDYTA